ncbi:hypothetical protein L1887_61061 [Cichorium endivia]|nr:hypothetical protein L1887_61061 [Cichorium endivia]
MLSTAETSRWVWVRMCGACAERARPPCQIQARALPACCWRCLVGCSVGWLARWLAGQQRVGIPICKIHGSSAQSHSTESTPRPAAPCLAVYVSSPTDCLASWSSRRVALRRARRPSQSSDITLLTTILLTLPPPPSPSSSFHFHFGHRAAGIFQRSFHSPPAHRPC